MATLVEHCGRLLAQLGIDDVQPVDLASAFGNVAPLRLRAGERLCAEGEPADQLFLLLLGAVEVMRADGRGGQRPVDTQRAPTLVGHFALIDGAARSATCLAVGEVGAVALDRAAYERLLTEASPRGAALRRVLLVSLATQLAAANRRVQELVAAQGADDATADDVDELGDLLAGAKVDRALLREIDEVEVVYTDEQLRNWRGPGGRPA
ncbi:MAG: cyclic nucleotide-binding domain-containing protein [Deltaproteobacteria bacterium]|jgi:CRP/FNR family cyclic AMP-dependent transcriptional regulator|nr:cyclic nucleotide-binding domain-containing protein [Deltaproteobacteria bacterium]